MTGRADRVWLWVYGQEPREMLIVLTSDAYLVFVFVQVSVRYDYMRMVVIHGRYGSRTRLFTKVRNVCGYGRRGCRAR